jgi:hypothetical protein
MNNKGMGTVWIIGTIALVLLTTLLLATATGRNIVPFIRATSECENSFYQGHCRMVCLPGEQSFPGEDYGCPRSKGNYCCLGAGGGNGGNGPETSPKGIHIKMNDAAEELQTGSYINLEVGQKNSFEIWAVNDKAKACTVQIIDASRNVISDDAGRKDVDFSCGENDQKITLEYTPLLEHVGMNKELRLNIHVYDNDNRENQIESARIDIFVFEELELIPPEPIKVCPDFNGDESGCLAKGEDDCYYEAPFCRSCSPINSCEEYDYLESCTDNNCELGNCLWIDNNIKCKNIDCTGISSCGDYNNLPEDLRSKACDANKCGTESCGWLEGPGCVIV